MGTWNEATANGDELSSATLTFNGSAIYVQAILLGLRELGFRSFIDGELTIPYSTQLSAVSGDGLQYATVAYLVPSGLHQFTIQALPPVGSEPSLLLDSFIYTFDDGNSSQFPPPSSQTMLPSPSSFSNAAGHPRVLSAGIVPRTINADAHQDAIKLFKGVGVFLGSIFGVCIFLFALSLVLGLFAGTIIFIQRRFLGRPNPSSPSRLTAGLGGFKMPPSSNRPYPPSPLSTNSHFSSPSRFSAFSHSSSPSRFSGISYGTSSQSHAVGELDRYPTVTPSSIDHSYYSPRLSSITSSSPTISSTIGQFSSASQLARHPCHSKSSARISSTILVTFRNAGLQRSVLLSSSYCKYLESCPDL